MARSLLRLPKVLAHYGCQRTKLYQLIKDGLFTPPVDLGGRCVAWPDMEVDSIINARIAGKTDAEIKVLVRELVSLRNRDVRDAA
ncbi:helix-turn-helix transcriptional regulator [Methylomagnum ishizawai]|uniref:helix-turn-helix transcriptional regulator n=1 Tax=Methylomagnum ishizawai TaxID=1760988 RepID=UPI001C336E75|nr:AlpA family phage regulatory protein [Methylomagnum ishizawai]BBL74451.1 hypothetical protein MishRS11D_15490 [Methylomagnum ishizawai]